MGFRRHLGDSDHEIINAVVFEDGAKLHRFNNAAGVPYSAIYHHGVEVYNHVREKETDMIKAYNEHVVPLHMDPCGRGCK